MSHHTTAKLHKLIFHYATAQSNVSLYNCTTAYSNVSWYNCATAHSICFTTTKPSNFTLYNCTTLPAVVQPLYQSPRHYLPNSSVQYLVRTPCMAVSCTYPMHGSISLGRMHPVHPGEHHVCPPLHSTHCQNCIKSTASIVRLV